MGWALQRNWPPWGIICPTYFGSSLNIAMDGGAQTSLGPLEKDDGWATSPSEACALREVIERPHGPPLSGASTSIALDMREHTPLATDARQMPLRVATLIDLCSKVGQGRHYRKNLLWRRRQKELCQTVRALKIHLGATPRAPLPHDNKSYH